MFLYLLPEKQQVGHSSFLNFFKTFTMKTIVFFCMIAFMGLNAHAQVEKVSLQASGLTCSMCSKAVYNALAKVPFVNKVDVDIKDQRYDISFKDGATVDFDALSKAVSDAGFSVAKFTVTANLNKL